MPEQRTITARSTPYRDPAPGQAICKRCGIQRKANWHRRGDYCMDCKPHAIDAGWIPRPAHYYKKGEAA